MNPPASPVIVGLEAIGEVFGRTRWIIRRWIEREGFPASRLPDGTWTTSQTLTLGFWPGPAVFPYPSYVIYPESGDKDLLDMAIESMRSVAQEWSEANRLNLG